jgi:uncharacterized MAPEG superfamily protein
MSKELFWLTLTVALTALMWIPYMLDRIRVRGLMATLANPSRGNKEQSPWAIRMMFAHDNAIENLVIFAPLVLITDVLNIRDGITAFACALYFWSRLAHVVIYAIGWPVGRTVAFLGGFVAQILLVIEIFRSVYGS